MTDVRFTEGVRQALVAAAAEAQARNHDWIGTEHLLLALTRDPDGAPAHVLASFGVLHDVRQRAAEDIFRPLRPRDREAGAHAALVQYAGYYREGLRRIAAGEMTMGEWRHPWAADMLAFLDAALAFAERISGPEDDPPELSAGAGRETARALFFAYIQMALLVRMA